MTNDIVTTAVFKADISQLQQGLLRLNENMGKLAATNQKVQESSEKTAAGIESIFKGGAVTAIIVGAGKAFDFISGMMQKIASATKQIIQFGWEKFIEGVERLDAIGDTAESVGATTEQIGALIVMLKGAPNATELAGNAINKLAQKIQAAREGNKDAIETFDKFGYTLEDISDTGFTTERVLNQLFYGFNELATAEEKAAAAQELFGKAGRELIPELNKGADAFEAAKRKALDYGVIVNEVASSNAQKTVENIGMIKNAFSGLVNQFASSNILTDIFGTIKTYAFEIVENIRKWGPTAEDALTQMLPVIDSIELASRRMIDGIKLSYAGLLYFIAQSNLDLNPLLTKESKAKYEMVAQRTQSYIENYDGGEYEPFSERYKRVSSEYDNSRKAQRSPQTDRIYDTSEYTNPANRKYLEEQNQLLRDIRDKVGGYK